MPKMGVKTAGVNHRAQTSSSKCVRWKDSDEDQERADLLADILQESSSIALNDSTSQLNARQAIENHSKLLDLIEKLRKHELKLNPELPRRDERAWRRFFEWVDEVSEPSRVDSNDSLIESKPPQGKLSERISIKSFRSSRACSIGTTHSSTATEEDRIGSLDEINNEKNLEQPGSDSEECSLITKKPLRKGETIFTVDRRLMLTTTTAMADPDLFAFIRSDSIASGMQNVVLVLHLLNEFSKRKKSYWWPYLSILPRKLLPTLSLTKKKLNDHLSSSAHVFEALKMLRAIARQYAYFYKRLQGTNLPLKKDLTFVYYAWGVSIVCSRQNEIPQETRQRVAATKGASSDFTIDTASSAASVLHALIPILDMCNHNRASNQATFENNSSRLVSANDLCAGQEVTINYGSRTSGEFYIHNGFVPDDVTSDALPMTLALNGISDKFFELRVKLLKILNMPTFGRFKLKVNNRENRHKRDPHLTMFLIVQFLNEQELNLISSDENPVGVADEIYEYVQYLSDGENEESRVAGANDGGQSLSSRARVGEAKIRLARALKEYMSRRASICVALIDRSIDELNKTTIPSADKADDGDKGNDKTFGSDDKFYAIKLLQHERRIHDSYIIKVN